MSSRPQPRRPQPTRPKPTRPADTRPPKEQPTPVNALEAAIEAEVERVALTAPLPTADMVDRLAALLPPVAPSAAPPAVVGSVPAAA